MSLSRGGGPRTGSIASASAANRRTSMGRPIIGITSELDAARWGDWIREAVVSPVSYTRALERAGATPVVLPPVPPDSVRARAAIESGLPFLAIGRGLHVLTVARGGTLTQHLPGHRTDRVRYLPHDVRL